MPKLNLDVKHLSQFVDIPLNLYYTIIVPSERADQKIEVATNFLDGM